MSATVVQYPVEHHGVSTHLIDDVTNTTKLRVQAPTRSIITKDPIEEERICLVLDMDECLIHSNFQIDGEDIDNNYRQNEYRPSQVDTYEDSFEIVMDDGERAIVNKRPGVDQFLQEVSEFCDIYVLTAGLESYAQPILDVLDPKGTIFAGRFYRDSCQVRKGMFLKDLSVVRKDLSKVILVDNNPVSFLMQPSNGIPVPSFYGNANDRTFDSLTKVLNSLRDVDDVRPRLHELFRLADLLADHQRLIFA